MLLQVRQHIISIHHPLPAAAVEQAHQGVGTLLLVGMRQGVDELTGQPLHLFFGVLAIGPLDLLTVAQQLRRRPPQASGKEPQQLFLGDAGIQQGSVHGAVYRPFRYQLPSAEPAQLIIDLADVLREVELDATGFQLAIQHHQPVSGGYVHADDAAGVHNDRLGVCCDGVLQILLEQSHIGEKQAPAEPVQHYMGQRLGIAHLIQGVEAGVIGYDTQKVSARLGAAQDHVSEGEQHTDDYAVDGAQHQHAGECTHKNIKFLPVGLKQPVCQVKFHRPQQGRDDDGGQNGHGQILNEPSAKEQQRTHQDSRHQRHQLGVSAKLLVHGRAGHAAVYWTATHQAGGEVGQGEAQDLSVVAELVVVAQGEAVFRQQRLRHDDDGH